MQKFKRRWQIQSNWQLLFPITGVIVLLYSAFKLANLFTSSFHIIFTLLATLLIFYILLKTCLFSFKKLEHKWHVDYKWELIRIFMVFAITGSSSMIIGRPFIRFIGITKENLNAVLYWALFIFISLIFYQILLVFYGWLFGQFQFFWNFEKKILRRFGLKRIFDE